MEEFEIMFDDLTQEAQDRVLDFFGASADDMNLDIMPIATIVSEVE